MFGNLYFGQSYFGGEELSTTKTILVSDSITTIETFNKFLSRSISESISLVENLNTLKVIPVAVSDAISLTESFVKSVTKLFSENVSLNETFIKVHAVFMSLIDSITQIETFTSIHISHLNFFEKIPLYEKIAGFLNGLMVFPWSDKYKSQGSTYSDKYTSQGSSYSDKYSKNGDQWEDKYH